LCDEGIFLPQFILLVEQQGASFITRELALHWAMQPKNTLPAWWAARLRMVRRFAQYLSTVDPRTEVPPQGLLPHRYHRRAPYIYSEDEIKKLTQAAKQLSSPIGLRPYTYSTLFGLLAVTGMRVRESIHLLCKDVDLKHGILTIHQTKFGKSRLVPLHRSSQRILRQYEGRRNQLCPSAHDPSFFISDRGTRLTWCIVRQTFIKLSRQIGLRGPFDSHGPRLHDFRHSFAVRTILNWYRAGVDVERLIPRLATYLGHTHINDTYWYLSAVPELMQQVAMRLDHSEGGALL
jgi:site-specific recombinase XerD